MNVQLKAYHAGVPLFAFFHLPIFHINHDMGGYEGNTDNGLADKKLDFYYRQWACSQLRKTKNNKDWGFPKSKYILEEKKNEIK